MVDVFTGITGVDANDFGIGRGFELLGAQWSDEDLRRRQETGKVDEVTQSGHLGNCLDGTFSKDGEETCERDEVSITLPRDPMSTPCFSDLPTISSWKPWLLDT